MSDEKLVEHLKWVHTALAGFCATYFFIVISGYDQIQTSNMLYISIIFFACAFPFSVTLMAFHIGAVESKLPAKYIILMTKEKNAIRHTFATIILIYLGLAFLVGHYSAFAFFVFLGSSIYGFKQLIPYLNKMRDFSKDNPAVTIYQAQTDHYTKTTITYRGNKY